MDFDAFLNQAWSDHGATPEKVAANLELGKNSIKNKEQIALLARLATHIYGEHLGQWENGILFLQSLKKLPYFEVNSENEKALARFVAALELCSGKKDSAAKFSLSDEIVVLALSAAMLTGQNKIDIAQTHFLRSLELAAKGLDKSDPANRTLAVTGNNLACSLEEKTERTAKESEWMILAAQAARKYWEIAGSWNQIQMAEYRLAMSYLKAHKTEEALAYAQNCLSICQANQAGAYDLFYACEAIALVEKARSNSDGYNLAVERLKEYFVEMSAEKQASCEKSLRQFF